MAEVPTPATCFVCRCPATGACDRCGTAFCPNHGASPCQECRNDRRELVAGALVLTLALAVGGLLAWAGARFFRAIPKPPPKPGGAPHERPEPPFDREP